VPARLPSGNAHFTTSQACFNTKDRTDTFTWTGARQQIPRIDLPCGTLR
jgi:hypothetical protein